MNSAILQLEQRDIELRLEEISLKRRQIEIEREQLKKEEAPTSKAAIKPYDIAYEGKLKLHYSNSTVENPLHIEDVCSDGSVMVRHGKDSVTISKKYSLRTMSWIKHNLRKWAVNQEEHKFWHKIADVYSRRFLSGDDKISHTTMQKLCYFVDSGKADVWFEKFDSLKKHDASQAALDGVWTARRG